MERLPKSKQFSETRFRYSSCRSHFHFYVSFISFSWQQHVQTQISNPISNPLIHLFPFRKQNFLSNDPLLPPFCHFRERHFFYICPCILPEQISCGRFSVRKPWQVGSLPCLRVAQALWDTGRRADGHAYREHQCTQLIALNTRAVLTLQTVCYMFRLKCANFREHSMQGLEAIANSQLSLTDNCCSFQ